MRSYNSSHWSGRLKATKTQHHNIATKSKLNHFRQRTAKKKTHPTTKPQTKEKKAGHTSTKPEGISWLQAKKC